MFAFLGAQITELDKRIAELDRKLVALHKTLPVSRLLAEVPGIGPIGATTMALTIDPHAFKSGRHFAAWLGLTPKENSTGGKQRLGGISRQGNERLRQLLVLGATPRWPNRATSTPTRGFWDCWGAGRAWSWRWPWPTRWPV
jgi:transposase